MGFRGRIAMSEQRKKFEIAAANKNWQEAFNNLNVLNMAEMLQSLAGLPKATRDELIMRRFAFKLGVNMPRMEYAWTVVTTRQLPLVAPGDLAQTGQVGDAGTFLGNPPPAAAAIKLNLIVFTDSIVENRTLFPELKQQAERILASQGNSFKLNAVIHP